MKTLITHLRTSPRAVSGLVQVNAQGMRKNKSIHKITTAARKDKGHLKVTRSCGDTKLTVPPGSLSRLPCFCGEARPPSTSDTGAAILSMTYLWPWQMVQAGQVTKLQWNLPQWDLPLGEKEPFLRS